MAERVSNCWFLKKIPRILHCYWGGGKLSYLRYLTIASFKYHNPEWQIILYKPKFPQLSFFWKSEEQLYGDNYVDCYDRIKNLNITIKEINFDEIGFYSDASEVHKSDFLRWKLLHEIGGVWADMDILFIKPIDEICFNKSYMDKINTVVCVNDEHSIGFLMGSKNNEYFKTLYQAAKREYRKEGYQSIGSLLCGKLFPTFASIISKDSNPYNLSMDIVYAYSWKCVGEIFGTKHVNKITNNTIGIHWFGGNKISGKYLNSTNGGLYSEYNSVIDNYMNLIKFKSDVKTDNKALKISIVMAFYNRQELLDKTLEGIDKSVIKDYELIIVDDASTIPLVCDRAKIIRVEKKDKWYNCSAVAWNRGMREVTGDIVILNSPECYHVGDILSYVRNNIRPNLYLSFGCYAINKAETENFHKGIFPNLVNAVVDCHTGWYNHTVHRPVAYHFCSAMLKKDLDMIGGFDERYAYGVAFDDDEFIRTIKHMGMKIKIVNRPYVIHQYHTHFEFTNASAWRAPHTLNKAIYDQGYNAKIHRDYGRGNDLFVPEKFQQAVAENKAIEAKPKKKILSQRDRDSVLDRFLEKLGGM